MIFSDSEQSIYLNCEFDRRIYQCEFNLTTFTITLLPLQLENNKDILHFAQKILDKIPDDRKKEKTSYFQYEEKNLKGNTKKVIYNYQGINNKGIISSFVFNTHLS